MRGRQPEGVVHHELGRDVVLPGGTNRWATVACGTTTEARPRRHRCNPISASSEPHRTSPESKPPTRSKSSRRNAIRQPQMNGTSRGWQPPERSQRILSCGSRQVKPCPRALRSWTWVIVVVAQPTSRSESAAQSASNQPFVGSTWASANTSTSPRAWPALALRAPVTPPRARGLTTRAAAFGRSASAATLPSVDQSSTTMTSTSSGTVARIPAIVSGRFSPSLCETTTMLTDGRVFTLPSARGLRGLSRVTRGERFDGWPGRATPACTAPRNCSTRRVVPAGSPAIILDRDAQALRACPREQPDPVPVILSRRRLRLLGAAQQMQVAQVRQLVLDGRVPA